MGGKTGPGYIDVSEILAKKMEEKIKSELDEGAKTRRNVFISFQNEDKQEVELLRGQAKNENSELEFNDFSLRVPFNSERGEYIRQGIRERIRQASVTVVYVGDTTHTSDWVDWEVRESIRLGKGVVAVHKGSEPPRVLPRSVVEHSVPIVPWSPVSGLVSAINRAAEERGE
jgi:AMMECR1 domain-containing protein